MAASRQLQQSACSNTFATLHFDPHKDLGYLATCRSLVHLLVRWQLPKKETERETLEVHLFCSFLKNNSPQ